MSITKTIDGQKCTFVLHGLLSVVKGSLTFTSGERAQEAGTHALSNLFALRAISEIRIFSDKGLDNIEITFKAGADWSEPVRKNSKTKADIIIGHLNKALYSSQTPLITEAGQKYIGADFINAVQYHLDDLASRKIIKTSEHGGGIKIISYDAGSKALVLEFSGTCSSAGCGSTHGATGRSVSQSIIENQLVEKFPGAFSRHKVTYQDAPDSGPL